MTIPFKQQESCPEPHGSRIPNAQPATAHSPQNKLADDLPQPVQQPIDDVDEASMESFPCSDPPGYTACHA